MNNPFEFYKRLKKAAVESTDNAVTEMLFSLILAALMYGYIAVGLPSGARWVTTQLVGTGMVLFIIAFMVIWIAQLIVIGLVIVAGRMLFAGEIKTDFQREENLLNLVAQAIEDKATSEEYEEVLDGLKESMVYYHGPRVDWGKVLDKIRAMFGVPVPDELRK